MKKDSNIQGIEYSKEKTKEGFLSNKPEGYEKNPRFFQDKSKIKARLKPLLDIKNETPPEEMTGVAWDKIHDNHTKAERDALSGKSRPYLPGNLIDEEWVRHTLKQILLEGQSFQLVAKGVYRGRVDLEGAYIFHGIFDNVDDAVKELLRLDIPFESIDATRVMFLPHRLFEDRVGGVTNKLHRRKGTHKHSPPHDLFVKKGDVARYSYFFVDFDPVKPEGEKYATHKEGGFSRLKLREVRNALKGKGWPGGCVGFSGNGVHLVFRIDLINNEETTALIRDVIRSLDKKFSDISVRIDSNTYHATNALPLYGCLNQKGAESTRERHPRRSFLDELDCLEDFTPVSREQLLDVAKFIRAHDARDQRGALSQQQLPRATSKAQSATRAFPASEDRELLEYRIEDKVLPYLDMKGSKKGREETGGVLYKMRVCPFEPGKKSHHNKAIIGQRLDGGLFASCRGGSCNGKTWEKLRPLITIGEVDFKEREKLVVREVAPPKAALQTPKVEPKAPTPPAPQTTAPVLQTLQTLTIPTEFIENRTPHESTKQNGYWAVSPSEVEVADRAVGLLEYIDAPISGDRGRVWRYQPELGLWSPLRANTVTRICRQWDREQLQNGKTYTTKKTRRAGALEVIEAEALEVAAEREQGGKPSFLGQSPEGFAVGKQFFRVEGDDIVIESLGPQHRMTQTLDFEYDPTAEGPLLDEYLDTVFGDIHSGKTSAEEIEIARAKATRLLEFYFASMTGIVTQGQKMIVCSDSGHGGSGKSVALALGAMMVPNALQGAITMEGLSEEKNTAYLDGRRLNLVFDAESRISKVAKVRASITGDPMPARAMYGDPFTVSLRCGFIIAINGALIIPNVGGALWRRIYMIQFDGKFDGSKKEIKDLGAKIAANERPALLNMVLEAGRRFLLRGRQYTEVKGADLALERSKTGACSVRSWLEERTEKLPPSTPRKDWVKGKDAFIDFREYCDENQFGKMSSRSFLTRVAAEKNEVAKSRGSNRVCLELKPRESDGGYPG